MIEPEQELVARGCGKWSDPDVPKNGWSCAYVRDLGPGKGRHKTCEMCEAIHIRFVHIMRHPAGLELEAGCICAGHMEGNLAAARARDDDRKRAAERVARRDKALVKARTQLGQIDVGTRSHDQMSLLVIPTLERLRKVVARRVREAGKDAKDHDYILEHIEQSDFLAEVELAITTAKERLKTLLAQARAEQLASELKHPVWWQTPKGQQFTTSHNDRVQIFRRPDGKWGGLYQLAGDTEVTWATRRYDDMDAAANAALAVLRQKLRKTGRLPA
ncbi:hypothetical protein [Mesorhizobium sp. BH1-1-4]|uniref:hypothetical protein n=1 Tax=Mesorhizobium sp. BH1-1-4 TaxID=2876662 RepID=UPI001CD10194|nr:hypothetical protein [Mesorhizobium sp. BH1-1-4]MBZ9994127.1 hypothetical protein [Mesorhizobium sp. BH1-1-4]